MLGSTQFVQQAPQVIFAFTSLNVQGTFHYFVVQAITRIELATTGKSLSKDRVLFSPTLPSSKQELVDENVVRDDTCSLLLSQLGV